MEGTLWKWTNYWSAWQTRWFVLENGILSYYKSQDTVDQGCKGSVKVSACEINVSPIDPSRMDVVMPGEQHMYLKAATPQERQQWLVALGTAKACINSNRLGDVDPTTLKYKKSELRLYCDLLMQHVHDLKNAANNKDGPEIEKMEDLKSLLNATCDTFVKTLEECVQLSNGSSADLVQDKNALPLPTIYTKQLSNSSNK